MIEETKFRNMDFIKLDQDLQKYQNLSISFQKWDKILKDAERKFEE